jgi:hypothetical protein
LQSAIAFCKAVENHPDLDVFFWPIIRNNLGMEPEQFRAQLEKLWESSPVEVAELGGGDGSGGGDDGDGGSSTGKVVRFPSFAPLTLEQVTEKIDELIAQGASGSYLTGQLNRLAATSQFYIGELRKIYYERLGEADLEIDREDNRHEVDGLLKLGDQSLDLYDYLPNELAEPLTAWCNWLSIRPAVAMTALFAGVSSLHKVGTELVIHQNQNFRVPPIIYSALVSPSGQRKSPIFNNIIRQPLGVLRSEKIAAYNAAMQDYEAALAAWEQSENKGEKPQKPKDPTLYYFTNATGEAIPVQASKDPQKALLALIDELSGLLKSENSYRSGRGSDKQDLLSYFDGSGQTVLRAGGVRVDLEKIYLSMFGTIQPAVLKSHMSDCSDPDGQWARFLFVNQPLEAATLSDDDGQAVSIRDRIAGFYRQIDQLPEMEYRLSRDAFKRYQPIYNQLERFRVTHPQSGMAAVYSKMEGYIGRLALNLHVLWEIASGKPCPEEEIPLFIMEMAIALSKFYIGQVKLIHAHSDDEEVAPHIVKLFELSKRLETNGKDGWIKAQQYRELFAAKKRPSAQKARDWMTEAVALGYGRTRGTGNRLEYHWLCDNNGSSDEPPPPDDLGNLGKLREELGTGVPYVETTNNQGVQGNLGNLGKGIPNSSLTTQEVDISEEEPLLEGGSVSEASLSSLEDSSDVDTVSNTDLGNNLGTGIPNSSLTSLSDTLHEPAQQQKQDAIASASTVQLEEQPTPVEQTVSTSVDEIDVDGAKAPSLFTATDESAPAQVTADEPLKVGDRVRFTNPEGLALLKHFEALELEVLHIVQTMPVATCKLPNGSKDIFGVNTLRKIE